MNRKRYVSVPVNEKGIDEYEHGVEDTENIKTFLLSYGEFDTLYNHGIFDEINAECNLLIDDYESEVIEKEHFKKCEEIIKNSEVPIFKEALELAIEYNTLVGLDF